MPTILGAFGKRRTDVKIDNFVFRLNYQVTVVLFLVAAAILLFNRQNAISCAASGERTIPNDVLSSYCETVSTEVNDDVQLYPRMPVYYRWLGPLLLWLALTFYGPHWLWINYENGRMARLVARLQSVAPRPIFCAISSNTHLLRYRELRIRDSWYGSAYYVCETLNFVTALSQFLLLDCLMKSSGQQFVDYGSSYFRWWRAGGGGPASNPERNLFPLQIACSYRLSNIHGQSNIEEVCVLPQNALNSKLYLFVWAWLVFMISINSVTLLYRMLQVLCSQSVKRRWFLQPFGLIGVCVHKLMDDDSDVHDDHQTTINTSDMCQLAFLLDNMPWLEFSDLPRRTSLGQDSCKPCSPDSDGANLTNIDNVKFPLIQPTETATSSV